MPDDLFGDLTAAPPAAEQASKGAPAQAMAGEQPATPAPAMPVAVAPAARGEAATAKKAPDDLFGDLQPAAPKEGAVTRAAAYVPNTIAETAQSAWNDLKGDWLAQFPDLKNPPPEGFWNQAKAEWESMKATGRTAGDAFNLVMSPVSGLVRALVVKPGASVLAAIPGVKQPGETDEQAHQDAEKAISDSLWALFPGRARVAAGPGVIARTAEAAGNALPLTEEAQARAAVQKVRSAAADPEAMEIAVQTAPPPLVEGSRPTLAQVAKDPGIDELERAERLKNPTVTGANGEVMTFPVRAAEQNAARVQALREIAPPSADPAAVGQFVQHRLGEIDAMNDEALATAKRQATEASETTAQRVRELGTETAASGADAVAAARERLAASTGELGGQESPVEYGQAIRDEVLLPARQVAKGAADALWNPLRERNPVLDATPAAEGAEAIEAKIPQGASRSPVERSLFDRVGALDKPVPWDQFQQLRSELGEAITDEISSSGKTPSWRRLVLLRGEMNKALAGAAERTAQADAARASAPPTGGDFAQPPAETLVQQWQREANEILQARSQSAAARRSGSAGNGALDTNGARGASATDGSQGQGGGGLGNAAGDQGVSAEPLTPTWDEAAAQQYQQARALTSNFKQRFARGAAGQALKESGWGDYNLADEQVAKRFLNNGPRKAQDFSDYIAAVGDRPHAVQLLQNYAASELRRTALNPDGTINPRGWQRFQDNFGDRLEAFPELRERMDSAAAAQQFLDSETERVAGSHALVQSIADGLRRSMPADGTWNSSAFERWRDANADRLAEFPEIRTMFDTANRARLMLDTTKKAAAWARQNFENSAIGNFLHSPNAAQTLGPIINRADALPQLQRMMIQLRNAPDGEAALAGLRSALATHLVDRFATGLDAFNTGANRLRGADLRKFFNAKRPAIETVLGPEGTATVENVVRDFEREAGAVDRGKTTRGSDTELNRQAAQKAQGSHSLLYWLSGAAEKLPWIEAIAGHPVMGILTGVATGVAKGARSAALAKRDALVSRMVLDPDFARVMFQQYPARPTGPQMGALSRRLNAIAQGRFSASGPSNQGPTGSP